jgi:acetyltransferase EpsM
MAEQEKTPVVILGAGGYATLVAETLGFHPHIMLLGCTDKALGLSERSLGDGTSLRILGDDDILPDLAEKHPGLCAVIALGPDLMDVRKRLSQMLRGAGIPAITAVHPRAVVSRLAAIGEGTVISAGVVISAGSQIGAHCAIGVSASVDHDAHLGDNVVVGQGARISSYAELHNHVVIEMGASINNRVVVGEGARVTGGAFVNTNVPDRAVVVGVPARVVRYIDG